MSARHNRMKAALKPTGMIELRLERRDSWGVVHERIQFSISRRALERALADATVEAPWKQLIR